MASIGSFTAEFLADVSGFVQGVRKAGNALDDFLGEITAGILKAHLIEDATKAAFRAIGDAVEAAVVQTANYGDEILAMSQKTGVATETLGGLVFAFKQGNASQEDLSTGLRQLSKNLELANEGSKKQAAVFEFLGVATKDATGHIRPLNDVLLESAAKFQTLPDGAEKSALAIAAFGKAGDKLIPTLNEGSEGIRKQIELAQKYGAVMSGEAAAAGDRFNDALGETQLAIQGLTFAVGEQLIPKLTALITVINDYIAKTPGATRTTAAWAEVILRVTIPAFGDFMAALDKVTAEQEATALAAQLVTQRYGTAKDAAKSFADAMKQAEEAAKALAKALAADARISASEQQAIWDEFVRQNAERDKKTADARAADLKIQVSEQQVIANQIVDIYKDRDKRITDDLKIAASEQKSIFDEEIRINQERADRISKYNQKISEDAIKEYKKLVDEEEKAAKQSDAIWAAALGNITSNFAKSFTEILFSGDKWVDDVKKQVDHAGQHLMTFAEKFREFGVSLFRNTASLMLQAFIVGLITPLTKELTKLGEKIADIASKATSAVGGFLSFIPGVGQIIGAFGAAYGLTSALLNRGGGQPAAPNSEYFASNPFGGGGAGGGFSFAGNVGVPQSYGPDSPAYIASQRGPINVNVNVAGNIVGISDLARELVVQINNLTRDEGMVVASAR